jgi:hypothetical protein
MFNLYTGSGRGRLGVVDPVTLVASDAVLGASELGSGRLA